MKYLKSESKKINAAQIIDDAGRGLVAYFVSFQDDPHG